MDLEQLTKSQIILLTLLVSFVTSIATGIVTVSLMEQGVTPVTQTINRVVERTREVIVQEPAEQVVVTEEKTVIVREADLIAAAVKKNAQSTAAVYAIETVDPVALSTTTPVIDANIDQTASAVDAVELMDETLAQGDATEQMTFVARGVLVDPGVLVTDNALLNDEMDYKVIFNDGSETYGVVTARGDGLAALSLEDVTVGTPATLGTLDVIARGKTVIALSGTGRTRIVTAVVADFVSTEEGIAAIEIDTEGATLGATLIDIDGNVIGMSTTESREKGATWFVSTGAISDIRATN